MNPNKKMPKNAISYDCIICDFKCSKKSNYDTHLLTRKHKILTNPNIFNAKNAPNCFECQDCNKIYKHASSLSGHKKKCNKKKEEEINPLSLLVVELIKTNQELQKQMLEVCQNNNTVISNNNNKTFNMQFFLNEQCKDAMNIMDFVNTFQLQFSDLENVGKVGYVEGISDIIIKKLNEMDVYKRPIHCSDAKRDTLFIKDKDVWTKETGNYDKLRLAIRYITKKNTDMLNPWCESHPGSMNSENYLNDIYLNIVTQAMGGKGGIEENENKIIRKIAKTVLIDK
jgi:hypothetical protein